MGFHAVGTCFGETRECQRTPDTERRMRGNENHDHNSFDCEEGY